MLRTMLILVVKHQYTVTTLENKVISLKVDVISMEIFHVGPLIWQAF